MRKVAVVLFNLGGPDGQKTVQPFLFNLFNDPRIIYLPGLARTLLAGLISTTRAGKAKQNYARMGGGSPILPQTKDQAEALQKLLDARLGADRAKVFVGMRYWKPFAAETAAEVQAWGADETVLLPLYPQFSSTTTLSAMDAWRAIYSGPTRTVCCHPHGAKFAKAHAEKILEAWKWGRSPDRPRVLFSAHGLPLKTIEKGDSYQWQVEQTVASVRQHLPADWEYVICYQSRVGPLKWLQPSTDDEIVRAAQEGRGVIVSPIAFVSEHIETLVELDVEYAELAHKHNLSFYLRAKALCITEGYIETLADAVERALSDPQSTASNTGARLCPAQFGLCPMQAPAPAQAPAAAAAPIAP